MKLFVKRIVCLSLAVVLCLGVLSGCNKGGEEGSDVVSILLVGAEMADTPMMQQKVIDYVKEKTGLTLKYDVVSLSAYDLAVSSGEPYDLINARNSYNFWGNAQKGAFMEITDEDLKEYAPYIWENGQEYLNYTKFQGKRYGIPSFYNRASDRCFVARGDLMDKYGITDLDSKENIEKFLDAVKEGEPDMIPFDISGGAAYLNLAMFASDLGWAPIGSLSYAEHVYYDLDDPEHKIFIAAETPEMLEITETWKRWNDKGFFSKSVLSNKTQSVESFKAGRTALAFVTTREQCQVLWDELKKDDRINWDPRFFTRYQKRLQYDTCLAQNISISAFSKNKANALRVLDLMYSDETLNKMLNYGLEGVHYNLHEDGSYSQTEKFLDVGPIAPECIVDKYQMQPHLDFPGHEKITEKLSKMGEVNPSVSMPTDDSNVREVKVALRDLYNQYTSPRMYGIFEGTAKEALEREVKALKEAGIDICMADLQKQLDAYYEEISK